MRTNPILLVIGLAAFINLSVRAEDFKINEWTPDHVAMIPGKNSEGSAILLTPDNPHSGKQCLKLVYNIQGQGYAEYNLNPKMTRPALMEKSDTVKVSFWIRGNPSVKLSPVHLRLIDAKGEVFQYAIKDSEAAVKSTDWTACSADIDLNQPNSHFSGNNDGVIDYPVKLLSFVLSSPETDSGSIYLDDLNWEQVSK